jgi:hypothetical protein
VQNLFNDVYWEERWHVHNYNCEPPVIGVVDFARVLQLAESGERAPSRTREFAAREQQVLASEGRPWPIVDQFGNAYVLHLRTGFWQRTGIEDFLRRESTSKKYRKKPSTPSLSPKTKSTLTAEDQQIDGATDVQYGWNWCWEWPKTPCGSSGSKSGVSP